MLQGLFRLSLQERQK